MIGNAIYCGVSDMIRTAFFHTMDTALHQAGWLPTNLIVTFVTSHRYLCMCALNYFTI